MISENWNALIIPAQKRRSAAPETKLAEKTNTAQSDKRSMNFSEGFLLFSIQKKPI